SSTPHTIPPPFRGRDILESILTRPHARKEITSARVRRENLQGPALLCPIETVHPHDDFESLVPPDLGQLQDHLAAHGGIEDDRGPAQGGQLGQALPEVTARWPAFRSPVQVDPPPGEVPRRRQVLRLG